MRRRFVRRLFILLLAAIAIAAAAVVGWQWWPVPVRPLEAGWTASVIVLAGDGVADVRDGEAASARFSDPFGVAVDRDGNIFIADAGDAQRIRRLSVDGKVTTIAGGTRGFADGVGAAARFDTPSGLAFDSHGTLYVADTGNNAIRRITTDGHVTTVAGDGIAGDLDGPARSARFNGPIGIAVDRDDRVIVADTYNDRIRAIGRDGMVRTIAGASAPGIIDGLGAEARFDTPCGVAVDKHGTIHVADTGNGALRAIDRTGRVVTRAGLLYEPVVRPIGIASSEDGDVVYVTDDRGRITELSTAGVLRPIAGSTTGFRDGLGPDALLRHPRGLAFVAPGRLIVADTGNALVRLIAARSQVEVRPPASPRIAPRFDSDRFGDRPLLWPVAPMEGPHEIAGTLGEARGSQGGERFHAGVDVRIEEGTPVHAVRDAVIANPIATGDFGTLVENFSTGSTAYIHIRVGRTRDGTLIDPARFVPTYDEKGDIARIRVKRGARFATGEVIGTVNPFNHVHLNVGWPGEEYNPLRFNLLQFEDTIAPTIARGGLRVYDNLGQPLTRRVRNRLVVSGRVQLVVDAWDQADGNRADRRLAPYDLGYQLLLANGTPAPGFEGVRHTLRFDRLAFSPDAARLVYAPGSGIPFFGKRRTRFLFIVTNTFHDGVATEEFLDTSSLPPGNYILRAWVADIRGNAAVANRDLPITIEP